MRDLNKLTLATSPSVENAEERAKTIQEEIVRWVKTKRLENTLERERLGALQGMPRMLTLRNGTLAGIVRHCRLRSRADTRLAIFVLITAFSDNDQGQCRLTIQRMAEMLDRTERSIRECIGTLELDGLLGVKRVDGLPNTYWPLIPEGLAETSVNVTWFADALAPRPAVLGAANPGTPVPPPPERLFRPTPEQ